MRAAATAAGHSTTERQQTQQLDALEKRLSQMQLSFGQLFRGNVDKLVSVSGAADAGRYALPSVSEAMHRPATRTDAAVYSRAWILENAHQSSTFSASPISHEAATGGSIWQPTVPAEAEAPVAASLSSGCLPLDDDEPLELKQLSCRVAAADCALASAEMTAATSFAAAAEQDTVPVRSIGVSPSMRDLATGALGEATEVPWEPSECPSTSSRDGGNDALTQAQGIKHAAQAAGGGVRALSWAIPTESVESQNPSGCGRPGSAVPPKRAGAAGRGWIGAAMMSPEPDNRSITTASVKSSRSAAVGLAPKMPNTATGRSVSVQGTLESADHCRRGLLPQPPASPKQSWYPGSFKIDGSGEATEDTEDLEIDLGPPGTVCTHFVAA